MLLRQCLYFMKKLGFVLFFIGFSMLSFCQSIESVDKDGLLELLEKNNDTTYVLNFWATWCSPCVAEIGFFEEVHKQNLGKKVEVILINLDFPNQIENRVIPFVAKHNLTASVRNMSDLDYNNWIPIVNESWSGAIPATLIFKGNETKFIPKEISQQELFSEVNKIINY